MKAFRSQKPGYNRELAVDKMEFIFWYIFMYFYIDLILDILHVKYREFVPIEGIM